MTQPGYESVNELARQWLEVTEKWMNSRIQELFDLNGFTSFFDSFATGTPFSFPDNSSPPDPYRILGLTPQATDDEVKARYRELLFKLHPDTAGIPGTDYVCWLVISAYQQIEKERGWHGNE